MKNLLTGRAKLKRVEDAQILACSGFQLLRTIPCIGVKIIYIITDQTNQLLPCRAKGHV